MTILLNVFYEIWVLVCEMAPYLLLGFLLAGLMHEFVPKSLSQRYLSGRSMKSVLWAALFGVPLPLCSCGVIPTAMGLRREGAGKGATIAFLIATPQTGVDSIVATYSLMGLPFALIRPLVAMVTAVMGGWLVNATDNEILAVRSPQKHEEEHHDCCCGAPHEERHSHGCCCGKHHEEKHLHGCCCGEHHEEEHHDCCCGKHHEEKHSHGCCCGEHKRNIWHRLWDAMTYAFVEMMGDIGKWLLVGLAVAGIITALVPDTWFAVFQGNSLLSILFVLLLSIPMYLCATGSIPIAVALMLKGLTPGAALVLLMAGPASNAASIVLIRKELGWRTLMVYLGSLVLGAVVFGLAIDLLLPEAWFTQALHLTDHGCEEGPGLFSIVSTLVLALLLLNAFSPVKVWKGKGCSCHSS